MPPRRQKPSRDRIRVPAARDMLDQVFRLHCQTRHSNLGFWARGEHEADHRLHDDALDHVHGEEAKNDDAESGEPDQGADIRHDDD